MGSERERERERQKQRERRGEHENKGRRKIPGKTDVPKLHAYNECEHPVDDWLSLLKSQFEKKELEELYSCKGHDPF